MKTDHFVMAYRQQNKSRSLWNSLRRVKNKAYYWGMSFGEPHESLLTKCQVQKGLILGAQWIEMKIQTGSTLINLKFRQNNANYCTNPVPKGNFFNVNFEKNLEVFQHPQQFFDFLLGQNNRNYSEDFSSTTVA